MKSVPIIKISLLLVFNILLLNSATLAVAEAAPARCAGWDASPPTATVLVDCNDYTLSDGNTFQPDRCYNLGATRGQPGVVYSYSIVSCSNPPFAAAASEDDTGEDAASLETDCNDSSVTKDNCGIVRKLLEITNILSGLVGIIIVIMITVGGIQYSASGDNPQSAAAAKKRIMNAIVGLVAFIFTYAFLQYIIPGGIL